MIRVYLCSKNKFPDFLITVLALFADIRCVDEPVSADLLLLYTVVYDRASLSEIDENIQKFSKPALVFYERTEDSFLMDSISHHDIAGAIRYASPEQVSAAIHAAATGLRVFNRIHLEHRSPVFESISLTPREHEILRLIADGEGNKSIAYLLEISEHTVKFHITSIFAKLHVSSRTEAIKKGIQRGLISI